MKKVSIRDFQLNASEHLSDLPIILTRYGKNIATVTSFVKNNTPNSSSVNTLPQEVEKKKQVSPPSKSKNKLLPIGIMCIHGLGYHEGCHGV